jgi:hypothetical protein
MNRPSSSKTFPKSYVIMITSLYEPPQLFQNIPEALTPGARCERELCVHLATKWALKNLLKLLEKLYKNFSRLRTHVGEKNALISDILCPEMKVLFCLKFS